MANTVSTEIYRPSQQGALELRRSRCVQSIGSCRSALGAFHAALDPVVGVDAGRWVHALGGKAHDVDDLGLVLLLVEAIGAVSRSRDPLVSVADGELDGTGGPLELETFERSRHLIGARLRVPLFGLLVGEF